MLQTYIVIGGVFALFFFEDLQENFPDKYPVGNFLISGIVGAFWPVFLMQLILEARND